MSNPRVRVAVLFGGRSSEHAVSCATAGSVLAALDPARYEVTAIGITPQGEWVVAPADAHRWTMSGASLPQVTADLGDPVAAPLTVQRQWMTCPPGQPPRALAGVDVVFPLLHGAYGEDGTVQGLLELSDTRYVGAGVLASALAMDKHYMKVALAAAGVPVGPYVVIAPGQWDRDPEALADAVGELGFPVFVKPARAGSSMGVSKVSGPGDLAAAIGVASGHDPKVLVEAGIVAREVECGVIQSLNGGEPETSLLGEIEMLGGSEFYDFEAKYLDDRNVRLTCPVDLPADVTARVQDLARVTFRALSCEGLARVDCFVTADGQVLVNELNTMPGFTATSMYPRMWLASGVSYQELVDRLIQLALHRPVGLR